MATPTTRFATTFARFTQAMWLSAAVAALGCGSDGAAPGPGATKPHDAADDAYAALEAADYAALPGIIDRLDAAYDKDPQSGRFAFYSGVMRFWRATGGGGDAASVLDDTLTGIDRLEKAGELLPDDAHVFGFLGIGKVVLGNTLSDQARIDDGRQTLADAVHLFPPYINGIRALAFGQLPRTHQYFPEATEALQGTLTACGMTDVQTKTTFPYPAPGTGGSCRNDGEVAHVYEGFYLTVGDIFVKNGKPDDAKALYANAKGSPTYDSWLLKSDLEARIEAANDRAALYLDSDTSNDPLTWMQETKLCVGCHARKK